MTATVPPEAMEAAIRAMAEAVQDPEAVGPKLFGALERIHGRRFRDESWDGEPSKTAQAEGRKGLIKTGMLWQSLVTNTKDSVRELEGNLFTFGTTRFYAKFLTEGAIIVPRWAPALRFKVAGEWVSKDLVILPPREFVGLLTDQDVEDVNAVIRSWLLEVGREAAREAGGDLDITGEVEEG